MVKISLNGILADIDGGIVTADRPEIASLLRNHLTFYPAPGPADPDPDQTQAVRLIAFFGGDIVSADAPPEYNGAVVY